MYATLQTMRLFFGLSIKGLSIKDTFTWQHHLAKSRRVESNSLLGKVCAAINHCIQIYNAMVYPVLGKQRTLT